MKIILTHEQADFDALASLLGAFLLEESAMPVLPRRMNRNVQAFLTLYGMELPFIEFHDLPNEPVEAVTLVDTQSMVSVRGISNETRVTIIDHHPLRDNLPENWMVQREEIGATTTLLVESLRERDEILTSVQATLLLLGIYEDTGSLTYDRTTARDLQAAAYLLGQGANLRIATNFLNHPLTLAQQAIYDELRANARHHHVHGYTIVIALGKAMENEELSTIAHKLRDLLDPDALFVLVQTRGGIQMISRSTSDNIDVAELVGHFGGGGHERAAAGLVRDRDLEEVYNELVEILPKYVKPAITVAQIMSRGPQVLTLSTPVEEAAQKMRRFGYEGYPIVQNGKVVGLLTRRAVDRAIAHNLHYSASSLMDAGSYTVKPGDSVEYLQRLMTESGWGQIPVVHPTSGELIGIATRTDLLKTLASEARLVNHQNLSGKLEAAVPPDILVLLKAIAQASHEQGVALFIVGGYVRDLLLNRPSLDFDLVVEGDAIKLAKSLSSAYGGRVTSHARFGTAKWHLLGSTFALLDPGHNRGNAKVEALDLVSARTEFYTHPSALPTVERGNIKLDLHRRDFTINTLAMRLDGHHYGELHDYWGGLNDLRQGLVRALHSLSFVDDPTRMLRAVRFEQRFDFRIESRTLQLLKEAMPLLDRVSGDRIRHELNHILIEDRSANILSRLKELRLLGAVHPALDWDEWLETHWTALPGHLPDPIWGLELENPIELKRNLAYLIWFLRLTDKQANEVSRRLKMPVALSTNIQAAIKLWQELPEVAGWTTSHLVFHLDEAPALARYAVFLAAEPGPAEIIQKYVYCWQFIQPGINGHDLRKMGLAPGPIYRKILSELRAAWIDERVKTPEQERDLLEQLLVEDGK
jgi:tRNA nucleotidyltransferase (CCA-adding enzyme)